MKNGLFEPGDIVALLESGELWLLEHKIDETEITSWGVSNNTGDSILNHGSFRLATEEEQRIFQPSPLYR
ncbi:MAG: hypothetical protein AAB645_01450 [Patescibacteria group bacterium]